MSLEKLNNKNLIFYTIEQALKCKLKKKIILTTSDTLIIKKVRKKYKTKVNIHKRDKKLSFENVDMKKAIIKSVEKFYKNSPDIIVILGFENPLRESFYIEKAVNTLVLNSTKMVISVNKDIGNNYFFYGRKGLKSLRSNQNMKLEREAIYLQKGGISVFDYVAYKKSKNIFNNPTGHILIDNKSSFNINSRSDLNIGEQILKKKLTL